MTIGDIFMELRNDKEIQAIKAEWLERWGPDDFPIFETFGGETLDEYRKRLREEFRKKKNS